MRSDRIVVPDEDIVQAYQETKSTLKVAAMFGISQTTVSERLHKNGVKCDGRAHMGGGKKRVSVSDDEIIAAYAELRSPRKVAERLNIGTGTVERRLQRHGVERNGVRGVTRKLPPTIGDEYASGMSMNAIARKHGACLATVADALHRAGITSRKRGSTRRELSVEKRNMLVQMYRELGAQDRVARAAGVAQTTVSRALRSSGIEIRPRPPKKGRMIGKDGYVRVLLPIQDPYYCMAQTNGYVMEHRILMAKHLGRVLERNESIHHINGNRGDNRIENLQIRQGQHGNGVVHSCIDCGSTNIRTVKLN